MAIQKNFVVNAGLEVGAANVSITPTGNVTISNNVTIGNSVAVANGLTVGTTLNVTGVTTLSANLAAAGNVALGGNSIVLISGASGAPSRNAAVTVNRGTSPNVAIRWNETADTWQITTDGSAFGNIHSTLTDIILGTHTTGSYVATIESNTAAITFSASGAETAAVVANVRSANTTVDGITQLLDSVTSTSVTLAATANSVKRAYDTAVEAYSNAELFSSNATNLTNGTVPYARIPTNIVNTTSSFTMLGTHTFNANVVYNTSTRIFANGAIGAAGQVLTANATGQVYWNTPTVYVSSVASGNGITGGPITTSGTLSIVAGTGIVSNTSGVHVNSAFIASVTSLNANNASFLNGQAPSFYLNAGNLSTGLVPTARLAATGTANSSTYLRGDQTWATITSGVTTVTGGAGLTGGTSGDVTLNVGEGVGITVGVDSVGVKVAAGSGLTANSSGVFLNITDSVSTISSSTAASATAVKSAYDLAASKGTGTVTGVTAGSGLTGGTITTSGTLAVGQGSGISVTASAVNVNAGSGLVANSSGLFVNASSIAIGVLQNAIMGISSGSGWFKLPGGFIVQWGTMSASGESSSFTSFPITFPGAAVFATGIVDNSSSSNENDFWVQLVSLTASSVNFYFNSSDSDSSFRTGRWFAIGY